MQLDRIEGFKLARNKSWRKSAVAGLRYGLWFAPSTLLIAVGRPLLDAVNGITYAVLRGAAWAILSLVLVLAGLAGFVVDTRNNQG